MRIFHFSLIIVFIKIQSLWAQQNWPSYGGPFGNMYQSAPSNTTLAQSPAEFRFSFVSEEVVPGGAAQSPRYSGRGTGYPQGSGGAFSPIVAEGNLYQNFFRPSGKVYDTSEYNARHKIPSNWAPELWLLDADEVFVCMDSKTGKTKWRTIVEKAGLNILDHKGVIGNASPVYHKGKVFFYSSMMEVFCFDTLGQLLWRTPTPSTSIIRGWKTNSLRTKTAQIFANRMFNQSLSVANDVLIVPENNPSSTSSRVMGMNIQNGQIMWTSKRIMGSLNIANQFWKGPDSVSYLLTANKEGFATLLNPTNGAVVWSLGGFGNNEYAVIVVNQTLLLRTKDTSFAAYDISLSGLNFKWRLPSGSLQLPTNYKCGMVGLPFENKVYIRADGTFAKYVLVDLQTGQILYQYSCSTDDEAADYMYGKLLFSEQDSQHGGNNTSIMRLNSDQTFTFFGWSPPHNTLTGYSVPMQPAFANGNMYMRGVGGVFAYNVSQRKSNLSIRIDGGYKNRVQVPGSTLELTCTANGNPNKIEWYINRVLSKTTLNASNSSLSFTNIPEGTHLIEARAYKDSISGVESTYLHVIAEGLGKIVLMPDSAQIKSNQVQLFSYNLFYKNKMQWYSFYSSLQDPTPKPRLQYSVSNRGGMVDSNGYFRPYKWGTFWVKLTGTYNFETKSDSVRIIVQPGTQTLFHTLVPDIFLNSQSKVALKSFLDSKRKPVYEVVQGLASIQNDSLKALQTGTIVLKISHPGDSLFGPSNIVFDTIQVINLGNPNRLRVETPKDTIEAYGALALRATLLDNAQNSVPFDTIQWNVLTKGWITAQGVLTADTFLGVQRFEAVATKNNRLFRDTFEIFVRRPLEILSVDLTNSTSILLPEEICGAIPAKFWFSSTLGSGINLRNNKGVFTRSRFVSNFSSAYTTQDPSNTPNQKMMRIFLGSQSTSSILTLSVRNLPTSFKTNPYDVLVYWGNNENTAKTVAYKVNQGSEMFIRDANNTWKGTFTPSLATVAADAQNDQEYAHFKQVRDTGFTLSARMVNNVQRWGISGFQLVTESIEWGNREQIITFENISNQMIFPGKTLKLKAFASSGLPVSYALISGAAQISGDVLTFQGSAGSVKIMATQNGNNTFVSANPVEVTFQTFVVTQETKVDQESIFNFYPNPAKNELNISAATGAVVYILDLQGKLLMEASITSPYQTIPVEQLTAGTYLLKVKDLSGKVSHYKWIKE